MAVADVEVDDVVGDVDELELVVFWEEAEDEEIAVGEEVTAVVEDVATEHRPPSQM